LAFGIDPQKLVHHNKAQFHQACPRRLKLKHCRHERLIQSGFDRVRSTLNATPRFKNCVSCIINRIE
jgi:hypothetical protein